MGGQRLFRRYQHLSTEHVGYVELELPLMNVCLRRANVSIKQRKEKEERGGKEKKKHKHTRIEMKRSLTQSHHSTVLHVATDRGAAIV